MALQFLSRRSLKGEKATLGTSFWSRFTVTSFARIILRLFQFVMGLTVIGLYAVDLDNARKAGKYIDSKWVWSVVCGTLGAITSLLFTLPLIKAWFFFYVDAFIFLCFLIAFGIFGKMFIPENPEGNKGIIRMKNAVWVLLTNMLLWLITAVIGGVVFWKSKKNTRLTADGTDVVNAVEVLQSEAHLMVASRIISVGLFIHHHHAEEPASNSTAPPTHSAASIVGIIPPPTVNKTSTSTPRCPPRSPT